MSTLQLINDLLDIFDQRMIENNQLYNSKNIDLSQWKWRDEDENKEGNNISMDIRPVILSHLVDFNTNNYHEYNPWIFNKTKQCLIIDKIWFEQSIPKFLQQSFKQQFDDQQIIFETMEYPHEYIANALEIRAYTVYLRGFDYDKWYNHSIRNGPKDVKMINVTDAMKSELSDITKQRCIDNHNGNDGDYNLIIDYKQYGAILKLKNILSMYFEDKEEGYFIRMGSSSAKHDFKLYPINNEEMAIDYLTKSLKFYQFEYLKKGKMSKIILIPWNHKINGKNEFRVFVHKNKVTSISQQNWYNIYKYHDIEIKEMIQSILEINDKHWIKDIIYDSFVGDIWYDFDNKQSYLIECNPFGIFSSSGSALFDWKDHYQILYGHDRAQFRYVLY